MKKVLIILLLVMFPFMVFAYPLGDVNGDGKVGVADYTLIRKHMISISVLDGDKLKYTIREPFSAFMNVDIKNEVPDYISTHLHEFDKIVHPVGLLVNYLPLENAAI